MKILENDFVTLRTTVRGVTLFNNCDVVIGKQINNEGEWAELEMQLFEQILKPGMVCVDVGAHIGTHTVAMAQMVSPGGMVFSFEPQRIPFQMMCANVMLNACDSVFTYRHMVGDEPGWGKIGNVSPRLATNHGSFTPAATLPGGEELPYTDVERSTIDDLGLHACHLIKIDVEGAELGVLRGASKTIRKYTPLVYFEANDISSGERIAKCVDTFPEGYKFYWHLVPSQRKDNYYGAEIKGEYAEQNMIAVPPQCTFNGFEEYVHGETATDAIKRVAKRMREEGK